MKDNKYEKLIINDYHNIDDLVSRFVSISELIGNNENYSGVSIIGKSDFIQDVFIILLRDYHYNIGYIDFQRDFYDDDYGMEYSLSIYDDQMICIDKTYSSDGKPFLIEGFVFMYQEDCCQILIDKALDGAQVVLFGLKSDDVDQNHCKTFDKCHCSHDYVNDGRIKSTSGSDTSIHYSEDEDGNLHGFTASKSDSHNYHSYSFYTTEELNKDIISKLLNKYGF